MEVLAASPFLGSAHLSPLSGYKIRPCYKSQVWTRAEFLWRKKTNTKKFHLGKQSVLWLFAYLKGNKQLCSNSQENLNR